MRAPIFIAAAALSLSLLGVAPATAEGEAPAPSPDAQLTFLVELPHRGAALENAAQAVSTPGNPQFREYMTIKQAARQYGATDEQIANLRKVARDRELRAEVDPTRLVARLTGSVDAWEKVMGQPVQFSPSQPGNPYNSYAFTSVDIPSPPLAGDPNMWAAYAAIEGVALAGVPASLRGSITRITPAFSQYVPADDVPPQNQSARILPSANSQVDEGHVTPRSLFFPGSSEQTPPTNAAASLMENCIGPNAPVAPEGPNGGPTTLGSFVGHNQIAEVYGLTGLQRAQGKAASGRVAVFSLGGGFSEQDLADAAECFGFTKPKVNFTLGTGMPSPFVNIDGEATLDVQTVSATLKNADAIHVIQVAQTPGAAPFIDGYTRALTLDPLPHSITNSYGNCEPLSANRGMYRTLESVFQFAAVMGVSSVVAAGDGGASTCQMLIAQQLLPLIERIEQIESELAAGQVPADQIANAQADIARLTEAVNLLTPAVAFSRPTIAYPGSSPYVLSVGGTSIDLNADGTRRGEYVWNDLPYADGAIGNLVSTGGPSLSFDAPWYQRPVTRADVRSAPDVSAIAGAAPGLPIVQDGVIQISGGTSQSSPLVASALALVSAQEARAGRPTVGFANPWLYDIARRHPNTMYDVTVGENLFPVPYAQGSTNIPACCQANSGYDQASGLGVPNFNNVARHTRVRSR